MASYLHYYLVDHPSILGFVFDPERTPLASLPFVVVTSFAYLALTLFFHHSLLPLPKPSPFLLRFISAAHNLVLFSLSLIMAVGCSLSTLHHIHHLKSPSSSPTSRAGPWAWAFCFPPNSTPPQGPVFFWAYVFYLSKIYEYVDTLLILLSGGQRLSFLHVYHHTAVVLVTYEWLALSQSLLPFGIVLNASVHVVMYAYFFCATVGLRWRPRWKRAVTEMQIWQFVISFGVSFVFLWLHFFGGGCEAFGGVVMNVCFNATLLALFVNFHAKAYKSSKKKVV